MKDIEELILAIDNLNTYIDSEHIKDFALAIDNLKIHILKISDELDGYELSNIKKHTRELYETIVWLQYEAEEKEE